LYDPADRVTGVPNMPLTLTLFLSHLAHPRRQETHQLLCSVKWS
jgi:hypothetical protein